MNTYCIYILVRMSEPLGIFTSCVLDSVLLCNGGLVLCCTPTWKTNAFMWSERCSLSYCPLFCALSFDSVRLERSVCTLEKALHCIVFRIAAAEEDGLNVFFSAYTTTLQHFFLCGLNNRSFIWGKVD